MTTNFKIKLECIYGSKFPDRTTKGKIYEVEEFVGTLFKIKNDEGNVVLPIESTFKVVN